MLYTGSSELILFYLSLAAINADNDIKPEICYNNYEVLNMAGFSSKVRELIFLVLIAFILSMGIRAAVAEVRYIPSGSMEPTIETGDKVLTLKFPYFFTDPQRGDIVVFDPPEPVPNPQKVPFIKRLVGLPGDVVEVSDGVLTVNGETFTVPGIPTPQYDYGPTTVPEGKVFMLGDNRNKSFDSHIWGFADKDNIIAKAWVVIWPPQDIGLVD